MSRQEEAFDPQYEIKRATDEGAMLRKLRIKRTIYRIVGEHYIGKRVKLAYFRDYLRELLLPAKPFILEIGSGDGLFSNTAVEVLTSADVTGLELNPAEARSCQILASSRTDRRLNFVEGLLASQLVAWKERFDLVFCLDVLEHVHDDVGLLRESIDVLKPGGWFLAHVPNRFFQDVDGSMHTIADDQAWRDNPGHVRAGYTPDELTKVAIEAGFQIDHTKMTQGRDIARAHRLHRRTANLGPLRLLNLPWMDYLIRCDKSQRHQTHANTVWMLARKPMDVTSEGKI